MRKIVCMAAAVCAATTLSAQTEIDVNNFDPLTYELGERCLYVKGRHQELKTLRTMRKDRITRILEATPEEAPAMLQANGIDPEQIVCEAGVLWIEL